jgi:peptidoglycan/LPS O-acetylase OafA/YrhL
MSQSPTTAAEPDAAPPGARPDRGRPGPRLPYMPGVDGLRALAVGAVVAYHVGAGWLPGGFLGVDVFLVISGYLITSLLLAERRETGRIDLWRFWIRRARRLLPAVVVMIVVVLGVMAVLHRDEIGGLRGAALASLLYVGNWYMIVAEQSYFAEFARPSVFQHLWSLAVEEQFYLLWPPLMAAGIALFGRRRLVYGVLAGIVASTALAWVLFDPTQDPSRVYYGTDTRVAGLLVGVALAFLWPAARLRPIRRSQPRIVLDLLGVAALAALAAIMLTVGEFDTHLYRGGFLVVAVVTAAVLAVVAHPASLLGRFFALSPLVWIGVRSYGIYLWHWPVLMLTRPNEDVPFDGPALTAVQVGLTVLIAAASYRWIEQPFRRHGFRSLAPLMPRRDGGWLRPLAGGAAALALVIVTAVVLLAPATAPSIPGIPPSGTSASAAVAGGSGAADVPRTRPAAGVRRTLPPGPVVAVGDSVMLGATPALRSLFGNRLRLDAVVGRQPEDGTALAAATARRLKPGVVIVQLGDNGYMEWDDLTRMLDDLRDVPVVVVLTVRVDRIWEQSVNDAIRKAASNRANVVVADWRAATEGRGDLLADGVHPNPEGAKLYGRVIARAIRYAQS